MVEAPRATGAEGGAKPANGSSPRPGAAPGAGSAPGSGAGAGAAAPSSAGGRHPAPAALPWRALQLPFRIQLVILFFALDGMEKAFTLGAKLSAAQALPPSLTSADFLDGHLPLILGLLFDLLLTLMLALRTRAGRFWGIIYLLSLTGVAVALLVDEPDRWVDLGSQGRLRELATYAVNLGLAGILLGRKAGQTLTR